MEFLKKPRTWVIAAVALGSVFLLYQLWHWEVERVEVGPGQFLVKINLWGKDLPVGEIIAPNDEFKGIQHDVLPEGRYFLNPLVETYEVHDIVHVPARECVVLIRKFGKPISQERILKGDFLAQDGERGILRDVLGPGSHRINPYAYDYKRFPAVEIAKGHRGVRILKVGHLPPQVEGVEGYTVDDGMKGVQKTPVPPGTYFINPYVEEIYPVDIRSATVEFTDIRFPSSDGYTLNPHVMVKYQVDADKVPNLFVKLTDEGRLNQKFATSQDQASNQILQVVILPAIRGYVRIEGSKFKARDFIAKPNDPERVHRLADLVAALWSTGSVPHAATPALLGLPGTYLSKTDMEPISTTNARQELQTALRAKVPEECRDIGVIVEEIAMDRIDPEGELALLAGQITEREQARLKREQNNSMIEQHRADQKLEASKVLKDREMQVVSATTKFEQAKIKAEQRKEVEKKKLEQDLKIAQIDLEGAKEKAKAVLVQGQADADVIDFENKAQVQGLRTAVESFPSVEAFAQYHVISKLAPALSEIFASDASDFARLFASYMALPSGQQTVGKKTMETSGP